MSENNEITAILNKMSGNSDVITKQYYDSLVIEQRIIGSKLADISVNLFGQKFDTPIMLGVIGRFNRLGENALCKSALAAKELNTPLWVSSHLSNEQVAELLATGVKLIVVVKPFADQKIFLEKLHSYQQQGVFALATDIDHAYGKSGELDAQGDNVFGPKSVEELRQAKESLNVPFIAKGVLSLHDALACREAGLDGIVLSHHHNIIRSAVAPAMILPEIRNALGRDYNIIVDCGIISAVEAFKALALGANGLCVARPYMAPLAKGGSEGVVEFIRTMTNETREFLNRTGSPDIYSIDPTVIHRI